MTTLLGCPFCGGSVKASQYAVDDDGHTKWAVGCDCKNAPEDQPYAERYVSAHGFTREEAIAAWNRRAPAPQAQPDARAVEALRAAEKALLRFCDRYIIEDREDDIAAERAIQAIRDVLSAPAADDGWRPISDYDGCGPVLVSTAPESPKYLFSEPVSAFHDAGGTWRCLGSKGGMAETALRPTHFRPLPAPPVALHPAAPTDEVGKS